MNKNGVKIISSLEPVNFQEFYGVSGAAKRYGIYLDISVFWLSELKLSKNIGLYSLGTKSVKVPRAQQLLLNSPKELSEAHIEHRWVSLRSGPSISIDGLTFS